MNTTQSKTIAICTLISLALMIFALSCEHADPMQSEEVEPTFQSIQSNIFNINCALSGCHAGPNPASGLNLSEGNSYGNLVGVPSLEIPSLQRVEPFSPDSSYLVWKIEGRSGIQGGRMPLGRTPLSRQQINAIRQWIADGALPAGNAPVVGNILDQTIAMGESFDSFNLDDFVTDADHPDSLITWQVSMSMVLDITIDSDRVVTIDIVDSSFIGSQTVAFTATDPDGLSDSDTARFTILPPSLSLIQQSIFTPKCAFSGCHVGGSPFLPGSMDLRADSTYSNIVNVPSQQIPSMMRVLPGEPDSSYIIWKIEGRQGIIGDRMPAVGDTLRQQEVEMIKTWIREGAKDD